jgi:7,8-dihydroneopterin aldolase/epimerase/oxygenase
VSDQIFLTGMVFEGRHGVSPEERAEPQLIVVDATLDVDLRPAGASDQLADSVDYAAVFELCRARVEGHSYHLLEALAEACAADLLEHFASVERVSLNVRKAAAPVDGYLEAAGVRIDRDRA